MSRKEIRRLADHLTEECKFYVNKHFCVSIDEDEQYELFGRMLEAMEWQFLDHVDRDERSDD